MTGKSWLGAAVVALSFVLVGCGSSAGDKEEGTAEDAAVEYQEASNRGDWEAVCELRTKAYRGASVTQCAKSLGEPSQNQKSGSVAVADVAEVEASASHPEGTAVLVSSRVTDSETRNAFRVVRESGEWKVAQFVDLVTEESAAAAVRGRS